MKTFTGRNHDKILSVYRFTAVEIVYMKSTISLKGDLRNNR